MLGKMIDISPPDASLIDLNDFKKGGDIAAFLEGNFVKISFRLQIGDLVDSTIMQLYPIQCAKGLFESFVLNQPAPEPAPAPAPEPAPSAPPVMEMPAGQPDMSQMNMGMPMQGMPMQGMPMNGMPMQSMPQMGMPMQGMPMMGMPQMAMPQMNIQPAQFQSFNNNGAAVPGAENIGLIRDVPLEVTVELGRTKKSIAEILDFAPGTIIELDKIAGEPIDVLVNGKFVAKGEVVVIEESFGIRVTEIIK